MTARCDARPRTFHDLSHVLLASGLARGGSRRGHRTECSSGPASAKPTRRALARVRQSSPTGSKQPPRRWPSRADHIAAARDRVAVPPAAATANRRAGCLTSLDGELPALALPANGGPHRASIPPERRWPGRYSVSDLRASGHRRAAARFCGARHSSARVSCAWNRCSDVDRPSGPRLATIVIRAARRRGNGTSRRR